jgi:hypothetical protein
VSRSDRGTARRCRWRARRRPQLARRGVDDGAHDGKRLPASRRPRGQPVRLHVDGHGSGRRELFAGLTAHDRGRTDDAADADPHAGAPQLVGQERRRRHPDDVAIGSDEAIGDDDVTGLQSAIKGSREAGDSDGRGGPDLGGDVATTVDALLEPCRSDPG